MNSQMFMDALMRWEAYLIFFIPFVMTQEFRAIQQIVIFTVIYILSWQRVCKKRGVANPSYSIGFLRGVETSAIIAFIVRSIFADRVSLYTQISEAVVGFVVYQVILTLQIVNGVIQCSKYVHYDTLKQMMNFKLSSDGNYY